MIEGHELLANFHVMSMKDFDVILGMELLFFTYVVDYYWEKKLILESLEK